jgi:hypothetical protein
MAEGSVMIGVGAVIEDGAQIWDELHDDTKRLFRIAKIVDGDVPC